MKLSDYKGKALTDNDIDNIVFSGIRDNGDSCKYALVFGNAMLIKERTVKAVEMYNSGRVKKLVFMGGGYGISNVTNDHTPESHQMRDYAISLGVNQNDIIVEDKSKDTIENILFVNKILNLSNNDTVMLITSTFHLKRCNALIKKIIPGINTILVGALDGINDRDKWYLNNDTKNNLGRPLIMTEANLLVNWAVNNEIENLEIIKENLYG